MTARDPLEGVPTDRFVAVAAQVRAETGVDVTDPTGEGNAAVTEFNRRTRRRIVTVLAGCAVIVLGLALALIGAAGVLGLGGAARVLAVVLGLALDAAACWVCYRVTRRTDADEQVEAYLEAWLSVYTRLGRPAPAGVVGMRRAVPRRRGLFG